ncbi:MAG: bifunctional methionine sulfoxide reductase B/A protein [Candidatus Hydrogenedentales bacterium]
MAALYGAFDENTPALSPEEEAVIVHKATERPFTGKYLNHWEKGVYHCRRCNAPLYRADTKFDAGCGWPSFDDQIKGAVKQVPDADGRRTEIVCARCGGHLGHVFFGEGFTPKNTRHCVNSLSLTFSEGATDSEPDYKHRALFAGGCFWGVEYLFQNEPGVLATQVGYAGGQVDKPTYEQVCSGNTGHAEAVAVFYDPQKTSFETLAKHFFEIHDPTQKDRQGPDVGSQYRSVAFYDTDQERDILLRLIEELKGKGFEVVTTVEKAPIFWQAEDYHRQYYNKTGKRPYCHQYQKRF